MRLSLALKNKFRKKRLIVFDLDGTLAPTKATMDREMSELVAKLLEAKKIAVIGGGKYSLFKIQFLRSLRCPKELLKNLYLFPTTATAFYRYKNGWHRVYAHELSKNDRDKIKKTFREVLKAIHYSPPSKVYGRVIEDRRTQITFSALGQDVVAVLGKKKGVFLKEKWRREHTDVKMKIAGLMAKRLPNLEVHAAGYTSIDVTKKGIDKAYGLRQISRYLDVPQREMLFVGDAIYPGGNDYAVVKTGVDYLKVSDPEDTKKIIRSLIR